MKKKWFFFFIIIIITFLFSGCWSRREPKNLSMLNSILYDVKDDGTYQLTVEVLNASGISGAQDGAGAKSSGEAIMCEGKTVAEAVSDEMKSIDKLLFEGHNKARFFSEKLATKGTAPALDLFSRDHSTDETPLIIVVKDLDPKKIYSSMTGLSDMIGNYMENLSKMQRAASSRSVFSTTLDFMKDYYEDGKEPVAGLLEISKNEGKSISDLESQNIAGSSNKENKIIYRGLAAFRNDKLVGYLDGIGARDYNILTNNIKMDIITLPTGDKYTTADIEKCKTKIKTKFENGKPIITADVKMSLVIVEEDANIDPSDMDTAEKLENAFNDYIKFEILKTVQKVQKEYKSDIFGFGSKIHKQHPADWKNIKNNWNEIFSTAKIEINVESNIVKSGENKRSFTLEEQDYDS
ncbi:MAG: Ger(x)C family spore germination protein [Clostridiales bacterium]|nr:Ger(x)C family spore germination protein [Clostridiales bacterium]